MKTAFLRRALASGALFATTIVVAGMTGGSSATFSPDTVQTCKTDTTCNTIDQTGTGQALLAEAAANNGSVGTTANPSASNGHRFSGVWGHDISSDGGALNVGVSGTSGTGTGVLATSSHYVGLEVVGGNAGTGSRSSGNLPPKSGVPALAVTGGSHSQTQAAPSLIDGCATGGPAPCTDTAAVFKVANNGAITVTSCTGCTAALTRTADGRRLVAFAARVSTPTIEDVGEGQLTAGRGYVRLDQAFADTVDRAHPYLVMLTPEGPSRGLYVADRSPSGFSVRENPGGTSTLAFTYRIVAKPYDTAAQRLPVDAGR